MRDKKYVAAATGKALGKLNIMRDYTKISVAARLLLKRYFIYCRVEKDNPDFFDFSRAYQSIQKNIYFIMAEFAFRFYLIITYFPKRHFVEIRQEVIQPVA